ncbi:MAG: 4Fe-4S dicluster domain-containing protein [Bdellovibrionales bacterium]|nr:4Fe-4S dicluster domain-containing protein [Bdellovibrionales bacterium]
MSTPSKPIQKKKKKTLPPTFPSVSPSNLKAISMFRGLGADELKILDGHVRRASAKAGETIIELPDREDTFSYFFFIAMGQVQVQGLDEESKPQTLNFLRKGDFFVDKSFEWNRQIATKIVAITDSELLLLPKEYLKEISVKVPEIQGSLRQVGELVDYRNRIYREDSNSRSVLDFLVETGLTQASRVKITQLDKCIACNTCYEACEERHGFQRLSRGYAKFGVLDFAKSCLTCFYPTCIPACPVDSISFNRSNGEVEIMDSCIGCTTCAKACQYGAITIHKSTPEEKRFSRFYSPDKKIRPKFVADKCNHCDGFDDMACITNCPTDAIIEIEAADLLDNPRIFGIGKEAREVLPSLMTPSPWAARFNSFYIFVAMASTLLLGFEVFAMKKMPELSFLYSLQAYGLIPLDFDLRLVRGSQLCIFMGNIGFGLILLAMIYPVRKAMPRLFKYMGKKPRWLDFHNFCGYMGTLLVSFHTGFEFSLQGSTIGYFALLGVMLSGFLGRFLYQMIPRGVAGTELQLKDIEKEDQEITKKLERLLRDSKEQKDQIRSTLEKISTKRPEQATLFKMFLSFLMTKSHIRKLQRQLRKSKSISKEDIGQVGMLLHEKIRLARNVAYLDFSYRLFEKWQFIHRPFAYIMGTFAIFHILYNLIWFNW